MKKATLVRLGALIVLAAAIGSTLLYRDEVTAQFTQHLEQVQDLGYWGPILLAAAYVPACLFFVPGTLLTLAAGYAFGPLLGTITVSAGSIAGASAAFFAGRYLARDWVEERVRRHPKFRAIDQAVAEQGFKIVLLTRLSPAFPFNLLNYAYGLTRVRFRDYLLASWIGMLPGTAMYVYLGSLIKNVADLIAGKVERTTGQNVLFIVGLIATIVVTVYITRVARKALAQAIPNEGE